MFEKIKATQDRHSHAGGRTLGSLLWWHLNGNRISHADLEALASRHGLDKKYVPNDLKDSCSV
ncbi:MAG: hypothetical protein HYV07_14075 [Deltaproteobacteria bacterium]|nr:hypothetical protein [Deltaproteobacteria bacterium]